MKAHSNLYLFVIAGGSGTRFWPKSTSKHPKQLLAFQAGSSPSDSKNTLLGLTLERFSDLIPERNRFILTTQSLAPAVESVGLSAQILAEPQARNTAPCIYWAAQRIAQNDPNGVLLVMPSDHYVANPESFSAVVKKAIHWAVEHDDLVTLGIKPSRPETGYGYLKTGEPLERFSESLEVRRVEKFIEKPNLERANEFVNSGQYLWNGGMFVWRAQVILEAFDRYMPEMKQAWTQAQGNIDLAYPQMTATSIDYGIMEKSTNVVTFPLACGWDDVGSWTSLESLADSIGARRGENVISAGELVVIESKGNIIDAPSRLVALLGVNDLIVVEHGGALLVAHKDRAQDIRKVVDAVKSIRPDLV